MNNEEKTLDCDECPIKDIERKVDKAISNQIRNRLTEGEIDLQIMRKLRYEFDYSSDIKDRIKIHTEESILNYFSFNESGVGLVVWLFFTAIFAVTITLATLALGVSIVKYAWLSCYTFIFIEPWVPLQ